MSLAFESEKESLITALKILYEEQKSTPHTNNDMQTNNNGGQDCSTYNDSPINSVRGCLHDPALP